MMRQWQFTKSGHPRDILHIVEVPIPTKCAENEVLIKVSHVAFNSSIAYKLMIHYSLLDPIAARNKQPCVPEVDFSGTVCELIGAQAAPYFKPGDRVFGISPLFFMDTRKGVLREYILMRYDHMFNIPDHISMKEACCFAATGGTVYYAMMENVKLRKGDRVFITGASGGVGVMAIQLARVLVGEEGRVVVSCGSDKIDHVSQLVDANEIIDYKEHPLVDYLKEKYSSEPFDVIYDVVGEDYSLFNNSPSYLKPDGVFYAIGLEAGDSFGSLVKKIQETLCSLFLPRILGGTPRKFIFVSTKMNRERIQGVAKLMGEGTVRAIIDSVYKFDDVIAAYDRQMSHKVVGKVVVEVTAE